MQFQKRSSWFDAKTGMNLGALDNGTPRGRQPSEAFRVRQHAYSASLLSSLAYFLERA